MESKIKIRSEHTLHDLTGVAQISMPIVKQLLGNQGFQLIELISNWRNIVGINLAQYTLPYKLNFRKNERTDGCLTLITVSGAFALEIKQKQQIIINKINSYFGYEAVSSIKILQTGNIEVFTINKKPSEKVKKNVVSEQEENYITEITKDIASPELREVLVSLGRQVTAENKTGD